jgi:hypothetical protein
LAARCRTSLARIVDAPEAADRHERDADGRQVIFGADSLGFTPGDVQPLSEVFARALTPEDFGAP